MGSKFLFYLVIKPLSLLPFPILYLISDFVYFVLFRVIGYRKEVVFKNLKQSFPEKPESEIQQIAVKFYHHLADIIVESVKFFSISLEQAQKRLVVKNPELINAYADKNQPVILVGGHYCNWEIIAISLDLKINHQTVALYSKLKNDFFNNVMLKTRGKYGIKMVTTKQASKFFETESAANTATVFGADQSPTYSKQVIWTNFLNQETAVAFGTERYAVQYDYPVIYGAISRVKRGHYSFEMSLITDNPKELPKGKITTEHTKRLEQQIMAEPAYWLWTHKRWKRKRTEEEKIQ